MPYTLRNRSAFLSARVAIWHRLEQVEELIQEMHKVDFSVVESRRDGHRALNAFESRGFRGREMFATATRFPGGEDDIYVTQFQSQLNAVVTGLVSVLSFRQDTMPKDVKNVSKGGQEEANYTEKNGEKQDNTKRFEELVKVLKDIASDPAQVWIQETFETRVSAVWVDLIPQAQVGPQGQQAQQ